MRTRMLSAASLLLLIAAAGQSALVTPPAPAPGLGSDAVRQAVNQAVCQVTVFNAWGVPQAAATGFLLGEGRFLITDLNVVAQPGAARVTVRFADTPEATIREFGMADPAVGLAVLRLEGDAAERRGLTLAPALPALDGSAAVSTVGWRWATQLDQASGRLWRGPTVKDVAARARLETPAGIEHFVRTDGRRLEGAGGSPLLDSTGAVLAVTLDVVVRDPAPLGIPSFSLRSALLSATPQLKPLAELPKPLWTTQFMRIPGPAASPAECSRAMQDVLTAMRCRECSGSGIVVVWDAPGGGAGGAGRGGRAGRQPGIRPPGGGRDPGGRDPGPVPTRRPCPACHGEKCIMQKAVLAKLADAVEQATRALWMPGAEERVRAGVRSDALALLRALTSAGPHFEKALAAAVAEDLGRSGASTLPRGTVFRAQVQEHLNGPDGAYLLVAPWQSSTAVAVRMKDLEELGSRTALRDRKNPADGTWLLLAGTLISRFDTGSQQGLFLLPLEWGPCAAP